MWVSIITLLADTLYFIGYILLGIIVELVIMRLQFISFKYCEGHVILQVCIFFLSRIPCDLDLSYLCHSTLGFIILSLYWTN